jgi:hypothetical protein
MNTTVKIAYDVEPQQVSKKFLSPLETKTGFANFFFAAARWRPGAPLGPD